MILIARYAYNIGMITAEIPVDRIVLYTTVPVYSDADDVAPPSAARAAVITGNRSFPYSQIASTVFTARDTKVLDDESNSVPTATAPDSSIAPADMFAIDFNIEVMMHIEIIVTLIFMALCSVGRTSGNAC